MENEDEMVEVFAGELWEATLIRELLEDNGIEAYLENEVMGNIAPWYITSGGTAPVTIKILQSDLEFSRELIEGFQHQKK
ncbi:MAG: DUF2007 domain-containing protein [Mariniphaga sp.]